jgi:hypothetical protein
MVHIDAMKRLQFGEPTQKIEVKVPGSLKRQAQQAATLHGDGDVASWVRGLMRKELKALGIEDPGPAAPSEAPAAKKPAARAKKK